MLDLFFPFLDSFLEPLLEPTEVDVSLFIAHIDAFLASPDILERQLSLPTSRPLTEEAYKDMWTLRYQYHLGKISFLELLEKYEEMLGLPSPHTESEERIF